MVRDEGRWEWGLLLASKIIGDELKSDDFCSTRMQFHNEVCTHSILSRFYSDEDLTLITFAG